MVDEAHERSLNIDFILGLLKRVLEARPEFKVIVSSATINAEVFSAYFGDCPMVKIETPMYPGDRRIRSARPRSRIWTPSIDKVESTIVRIVQEKREGDILVFLPGRADHQGLHADGSPICEVRRRLHLIPLYGAPGQGRAGAGLRADSAGQDQGGRLHEHRGDLASPSTAITSVIDSGLAKLNFYNPQTYTASLVEVPISKASSNQRKGRAGRTRPGSCYRLFGRDDFENRSLVHHGGDLPHRPVRGGTPDGRARHHGFRALRLHLQARQDGHPRGRGGAQPPGRPRIPTGPSPRSGRGCASSRSCPGTPGSWWRRSSRYPDVVEEALIATSFLSTQGPFILPPGEEMEARARAPRLPGSRRGLRLVPQDLPAIQAKPRNPVKYCEQSYLDERTMARDRPCQGTARAHRRRTWGCPSPADGSTEDYLCAVSRGLIQFVCARAGPGHLPQPHRASASRSTRAP
ncbi:MAG: hypothetical protein MZU95_08740 [Desulfomicrobium escambiense]|nr:hypothetical protein [Desulfomicrobium escambiense]